LLVSFDEVINRAVKGCLHIIGEKTSGEFAQTPMIPYTLAANTLSATRFIGAVAFRQVFFGITFAHKHHPPSEILPSYKVF
jgi:hypothetical protein